MGVADRGYKTKHYDASRDAMTIDATAEEKNAYEIEHNGYGWMLFYKELRPDLDVPYKRWDGQLIDIARYHNDGGPGSGNHKHAGVVGQLGGSAPGDASRTEVSGKDISDTWTRRPNEFQYEIQDVINAQGFDGLPKLASKQEFEELKSSASVYGFRGYGAENEEILSAYKNQLYNGAWYVDCHIGTAAYGQGMYIQGTLGSGDANTNSMSAMFADAYGKSRAGNSVFRTEELLLSPDAKGVSLFKSRGNVTDYDNYSEFYQGFIAENAQGKWSDVGSYAAAKGFDYISQFEQEGSQEIVILNRTKLVINKDYGRSDSKDSVISFQYDEEGNLWAIRDKKVIGFIVTNGADKNNRSDANDWITINGTHVEIDKGTGEITKGPGGLKEWNSKQKESGSKGSGSFKSRQTAFTPKRDDYVFEVTDDYGTIKLSDFEPYEQHEMWKEMNRDKLKELYQQERQQAKAEGRKSSASDVVNREWYGAKTELVTDDTPTYMDDMKADEVLAEALPNNVFLGWFRDADSTYKPRVIDSIISSSDTRNAALSIMYDNYRHESDSANQGLSFEEFLTTPVKMYRGGHGQQHTSDDIFSAYSFSRTTAEKFAGSNGRVYEAEIRPIDTWGSITTNKESEIMVPSWIAPNGNRDSEDEMTEIVGRRIRQKSNLA